MSKDKIEEYEYNKAASDWAKSLDAIDKGEFHEKQSKLGSLLEAHVSALIGAPLAIAAHIILLVLAGVEPDWTKATIFASASWPVFLYLSVSRQWIIRRIFERYGINLEPKYLIKKLKAWWNFDL